MSGGEATGSEERLMSALRPGDFAEERLEHLRSSLQMDLGNLTGDQTQQMEDLVLEYADVFAMDSSELGTTDLHWLEPSH